MDKLQKLQDELVAAATTLAVLLGSENTVNKHDLAQGVKAAVDAVSTIVNTNLYLKIHDQEASSGSKEDLPF